jgi:5-formyltetrahydrofolate cyclo-ligase
MIIPDVDNYFLFYSSGYSDGWSLVGENLTNAQVQEHLERWKKNENTVQLYAHFPKEPPTENAVAVLIKGWIVMPRPVEAFEVP